MVQDISRILSNTAPVECLHNCMRRSHCQKTQHRQDAAHQCRWGESEDRSVRTNKRPQNHRDERTRHPVKPGANARARHRPHTPTDLGMGYQRSNTPQGPGRNGNNAGRQTQNGPKTRKQNRKRKSPRKQNRKQPNETHDRPARKETHPPIIA